MNKIFGAIMVAAALGVSAGAAMADDKVSEQRAIDARVVKVKLGGIISLNIKQGPAATLVLIGDKRDVAKVSVSQGGDTLTIDTESSGWNFGRNERHEVRAELTLPNLNELVSHGVGATDIKGFTGNEVRLSLDGAGSVKVDSSYKNVVARLGGVGSMTLNSANADQVDLKLRGMRRRRARIPHRDARPVRGAPARHGQAAVAQTEHEDGHVNEPTHLSFNEAKPTMHNSMVMIQKRTTTWVSFQPLFSKWWCKGAIFRMRRPVP